MKTIILKVMRVNPLSNVVFNPKLLQLQTEKDDLNEVMADVIKTLNEAGNCGYKYLINEFMTIDEIDTVQEYSKKIL